MVKTYFAIKLNISKSLDKVFEDLEKALKLKSLEINNSYISELKRLIEAYYETSDEIIIYYDNYFSAEVLTISSVDTFIKWRKLERKISIYNYYESIEDFLKRF